MSEEPHLIDAERAFDAFAEKGSALEQLGKAMQNPDTTLSQLVEHAFAGGWRLCLSFDELFPKT